MITLKDFLEAGNYRVTEGNIYGWDCYGDHAYSLDIQVGDFESPSAHIVFDQRDQTVYQATAYDYDRKRAYRLFNPDHKDAHNAEAAKRNVSAKEAWEGVTYTDLEVEEDFLDKMTAILNYEDYDTKVSVPIDLSDAELFKLMKMAHERDVTLNQFVEEILTHAISKIHESGTGEDR
jgi:hypothetical protein